MALIRKHVDRFFVLFFLLLTVVLLNPLYAQSDFKVEEPKQLQRQINDLREAQKAIQKDLQEIKILLRGRAAAPNLPPTNLTLRIAASPFRGDENAKLTLIEFSDYQCPFCARFFKETLPGLEKEYISTGKIKYVIRDFPLEAIHRDAFKAHEAANCAGEQGRYWEMHDRFFENQNRLAASELSKHAEVIGLNPSEFEGCLEGGKYAAQIRKDIEEGRSAGVNGTPTFFLGLQDSENGNLKVLSKIAGAQPYSLFKEAIERALNEMAK